MSDKARKQRRTKAQMDVIRDAILDIVNKGHGMTVRHLFYRLVGAGVIDKTEAEYNQVVSRLAKELRRSGDIPFRKIIDGSRLYSAPATYDSIEDAVNDCAASYRRSYWRTAPVMVEVWCEKDAIRALIEDVTWDLAVPLMITRGFASESVVQSLAEETKRSGKPRIILSLNDYDPSGAMMMMDIISRAIHYAPDAKIYCHQVALTQEQVAEYDLPTRPTKRVSDSGGVNHHAASFDDENSVELDAMDPDILQQLLRDRIETMIDPRALEVMKATEESERDLITDWADRLRDGG